jgi:hypothetical protein
MLKKAIITVAISAVIGGAFAFAPVDAFARGGGGGGGHGAGGGGHAASIAEVDRLNPVLSTMQAKGTPFLLLTST